MRLAALLIVTSVTLAHADAKLDGTAAKKAFVALPPQPAQPQPSGPGPRFAFGPDQPHVGEDLLATAMDWGQFGFHDHLTFVAADDQKAGWLVGAMDVWMPLSSAADDVPNRKRDGEFHTLALFEPGPVWVMWHTGWTTLRKAPHPTWKTSLPAVDTKIDAGANDAVAAFKASIGDPAKLAASVFDGDQVALLGSEEHELYTGKAVAKQLLAWNLAFAVHDGIQAGVTKSKTVAWVAANVDARPVGKPAAKSTPYRVTAIYMQVKGAWRLMALQFSSVPARY